MIVSETFKLAIAGFYQGAIEYDGLTWDQMIDIGVPMVFQSRCPALLAFVDGLIAGPDDDVVDVWNRASENYLFEDADVVRDILRRIRARVAERVASGGGGMPG
jgi:hypothetical protein